MSLLARLQEDMKTAMKTGQKERLSVLRMLISDVKNIDLAPKKISEEETVAAYGKKLRKSMEEYEKLNKADEVAQLKKEPSNYGLLAELNTRPRTTYLAVVRNPNPELKNA